MKVLLLLLLASAAIALCPSNGNVHTLYVTLNDKHDIMSLDSDGRFVGGVINFSSVPSNVRFAKLRAMTFGPDGNLYVSSALSDYSSIIVLSGEANADCTRNYLGRIATLSEENPLMDHPYDVRFLVVNGVTTMFVANQNTATVTRYCGPDATGTHGRRAAGHTSACGVVGSPLAAPSHVSGVLRSTKPGEFITPRHPRYSLTSVRGIATTSFKTAHGTKNIFFVCDVDQSEVHVFDLDGNYLWNYDHKIPFPIQVFIPDGRKGPQPFFYATTKTAGSIFKGTIDPSPVVVPLLDNQPMRYTSGMTTIPHHDTLLIADRQSERIYSYGVEDRGTVALTEQLGLFGAKNLGDHPEHLLYLQIRRPQTVPFCYELGGEGLRLSPLCGAVYIWSGAILATATWYFGRKVIASTIP